MSKVSIIIPSRGEKEENLLRTIASIQNNATGDYEVLVGFNGSPYIELPEWVKVLKFSENMGIKSNINALVGAAHGKYIYKSDAHCSFGKGFDEILQANMEDDWVVTPRFYVLNGETWQWQDERFYDYFYLSCPFTDKRGLRFKAGGHWLERTQERLETLIDETPQIHGSGWFMTRDRFFELGGFPVWDPYGHAQEPIWLAMRNWIQHGKTMVNKKTWYAHLHQDSKDRGYPEDKDQTEETYKMTVEYWLKEPGFRWFIDTFMPMPTWPENWKEEYERHV